MGVRIEGVSGGSLQGFSGHRKAVSYEQALAGTKSVGGRALGAARKSVEGLR